MHTRQNFPSLCRRACGGFLLVATVFPFTADSRVAGQGNTQRGAAVGGIAGAVAALPSATTTVKRVLAQPSVAFSERLLVAFSEMRRTNNERIKAKDNTSKPSSNCVNTSGPLCPPRTSSQ